MKDIRPERPTEPEGPLRPFARAPKNVYSFARKWPRLEENHDRSA